MDTAPGHPDNATAFLDAGGAQGLQVGSYNVQHNQFGYIPPVVRSAYLEQVHRIAPPELMDRDTELAELAAFCAGDSDHAYAWWRAPARGIGAGRHGTRSHSGDTAPARTRSRRASPGHRYAADRRLGAFPGASAATAAPAATTHPGSTSPRHPHRVNE